MNNKTFFRQLFILLLLVATLVGCGAAGENTTITPQATAASIPTEETPATEPPPTEPAEVIEPTAAPEPSPTASGPRLSGVPEADAVIPALLAHDTEAIRELIHFSTIPCTTAEGLGGPPKCLEGEEEGTPVEAFPTLGSEGGHTRPEEIDTLISLLRTDELYAVYGMSEQVYADEAYPRGRYGILFLGDEEGIPSTTVHVTENGIVRIDYHLGETADEVMARESAVLLLAPQQ